MKITPQISTLFRYFENLRHALPLKIADTKNPRTLHIEYIASVFPATMWQGTCSVVLGAFIST